MNTNKAEHERLRDAAGEILRFGSRKSRSSINISMVSFPRADVEQVLDDLADFIAKEVAAAQDEAIVGMAKRLMESRATHSQVTNGHIHVKNVDYEYWKVTGRSLL